MRPLTSCLLLTLAACSPSFQTTTGDSYLARAEVPIDPAVAEIAAVEGHLQFPARIGVVRMVSGRVQAFTAAEGADLDTLFRRATGFGTFQPLSPLVTRMVAAGSEGPVDGVRRGAARQHLDYLIVFNLDPDRNAGEVVFLDVRNGYPYATAQTALPGDGTGPWASQARQDRVAARLTTALVPELEQMLQGLAARED
jgi:hypothetical protein